MQPCRSVGVCFCSCVLRLRLLLLGCLSLSLRIATAVNHGRHLLLLRIRRAEAVADMRVLRGRVRHRVEPFVHRKGGVARAIHTDPAHTVQLVPSALALSI